MNLWLSKDEMAVGMILGGLVAYATLVPWIMRIRGRVNVLQAKLPALQEKLAHAKLMAEMAQRGDARQ